MWSQGAGLLARWERVGREEGEADTGLPMTGAHMRSTHLGSREVPCDSPDSGVAADAGWHPGG